MEGLVSGFPAAVIGLVGGFLLSAYLAQRGTNSATRDLDGAPLGDPGEFAMRQTRQDVAAILTMLPLTNALLAAIAAALIF
jgi:hypothetical protein